MNATGSQAVSDSVIARMVAFTSRAAARSSAVTCGAHWAVENPSTSASVSMVWRYSTGSMPTTVAPTLRS